jgi:methylated-DNA-[protein]-cysteine S-methyltransferase
MAELFFDKCATEVGVIGVLAGPAGVRRVGWRLNARGASAEPHPTVQRALSQLREYFAGERREFDLTLEWPRLEPTTAAVLRALLIGSIMAANPWPVIVPCHRVVAATGLGGYSGGERGRELETKRRLLEKEGALPPVLV